MLINAADYGEHRVAIVEDGQLVELDIELAGKEQTRGNIYKGVVDRVEPGLQAAFIEYGGNRPGFLQINEVDQQRYAPRAPKQGRPQIADLLHRGQEVLVQIVKEERGGKGAALTTFLSLPGRYMVLMPGSHNRGISRKIESESQRKRLREAMDSLHLADDMGYIVRTAGEGRRKEELRKDGTYLQRLYSLIKEQSEKIKAPALIYKESNLVIRSIRDYFTSDMEEVLVDNPQVCQEAKNFFEEVMPQYAKLVKRHQEKRPLFARYQLEEQIAGIHVPRVDLPGGGSLVIDITEALISVDVNSGKMGGEASIEETAYKTNLEAAREVARQLRLRDLGGLIVIDFIDMRDSKHPRAVEKELKTALKQDKARVTVGRISRQFGLLEMSRQRIRSSLRAAAMETCPVCRGTGQIKSLFAQAVDLLRHIRNSAARGQQGQARVYLHPDLADHLYNEHRGQLAQLEKDFGLTFVFSSDNNRDIAAWEVSWSEKAPAETSGSEQDYIEAQQLLEETPATSQSPSPAHEPGGEDAGETQQQDATNGKESASKRSSRRRRRPRRRSSNKGADDNTATSTSAQNTPEAQSTPSDSETQPTDASQSESTSQTEAPTPGQEPAPSAQETQETASGSKNSPNRSRSSRNRRSAKKPHSNTATNPNETQHPPSPEPSSPEAQKSLTQSGTSATSTAEASSHNQPQATSEPTAEGTDTASATKPKSSSTRRRRSPGSASKTTKSPKTDSSGTQPESAGQENSNQSSIQEGQGNNSSNGSNQRPSKSATDHKPHNAKATEKTDPDAAGANNSADSDSSQT